MSFILDALKKSEAERQRQAGPALLEMRVVRPQRRFPVWLIVMGAALILLNLVGMLWLFLRPAPQVTTAVPAPVVTPAPAAGAAAAANGPASTTPLLAPGERIIGPGSAPAQVPALVGDTASLPAANAAGSQEPADTDVNPADFVPAGAARVARDGALRSYSDVSNLVPAMRLDLHVYDPLPAQRYAFINMKKVREGDATPDGSRVVEITRDGVVLDYRSTTFLLTSDSSAPAGSAAR